MDPNARLSTVKYLKILFWISIASLVRVALTGVLILGIGQWIDHGITLCKVFCLFRLAESRSRYSQAAKLLSVSLALDVAADLLVLVRYFHIELLFWLQYLLPAIAGVLLFGAMFIECGEHGRLAVDADPAFPRKWNMLCLARIAVIAVSYPCAYLATNLLMSVPIVYTIVMYLPTVLAGLLSLVYLEYLHRTIRYLE